MSLLALGSDVPWLYSHGHMNKRTLLNNVMLAVHFGIVRVLIQVVENLKWGVLKLICFMRLPLHMLCHLPTLACGWIEAFIHACSTKSMSIYLSIYMLCALMRRIYSWHIRRTRSWGSLSSDTGPKSISLSINEIDVVTHIEMLCQCMLIVEHNVADKEK